MVEQVSDRSGLVRLASQIRTRSSDDNVHLPGFLRFDAGVLAQIDASWKARLNIENIFNKGYWASAEGNNNISLGQPRTFRFKVREGAAGPSQRPSRVATFAAAELRSEQGGSKLGK